MPKRCPLCGRSSADTKFYGEFCSFCTEKKMLEKLPGEINLTYCHYCGMVKSKGAFKKQTKESLQEAVSQVLRGYSIKIIGTGEDTMELEITEDLPEYSIAVKKDMHVNWKKSLCDRCNKIAGSYYEAVVQLRGTDTDKMDRFIKKITRYLERRGGFLTKVVKADNGLDVYLSDKKAVAEYLSSHGIQAVASYTLYGLKNGKRVYRHTYAVRV